MELAFAARKKSGRWEESAKKNFCFQGDVFEMRRVDEFDGSIWLSRRKDFGHSNIVLIPSLEAIKSGLKAAKMHHDSSAAALEFLEFTKETGDTSAEEVEETENEMQRAWWVWGQKEESARMAAREFANTSLALLDILKKRVFPLPELTLDEMPSHPSPFPNGEKNFLLYIRLWRRGRHLPDTETLVHALSCGYCQKFLRLPLAKTEAWMMEDPRHMEAWEDMLSDLRNQLVGLSALEESAQQEGAESELEKIRREKRKIFNLIEKEERAIARAQVGVGDSS